MSQLTYWSRCMIITLSLRGPEVRIPADLFNVTDNYKDIYLTKYVTNVIDNTIWYNSNFCQHRYMVRSIT